VQQGLPAIWASAQAGRLNVLLTLADRGVGGTNLNEVIKEFKDALKALEDKNVSFIRARLQRSLALALTTFGRRQGSPGALTEAGALLFEVMTVLERDKTPYDWAITQLAWGLLCADFSNFDKSMVWYLEAEKAYRRTLTVLNRDEYPLFWAITTGALGTVLSQMGELENKVERMHEAERLLKSALDVLNPEHVPLLWARLHTVMAHVLTSLAEQGWDTDHSKIPGEVFSHAMKIIESTESADLTYTRRTFDQAKLVQAVVAAREPLKKLRKEDAPLEWARVKHQLDEAATRRNAVDAEPPVST
jgi:tetratricopeptide (TPR) repeat protein